MLARGLPALSPPSRRRALVILASAGLLGSCSSMGPEGGNLPSGLYQRRSYQGQSLPVTEFEIPRRDGTGSGCFAVVTTGDLGLDQKRSYFLITVHRQDTCAVTSFGDGAVAEGDYTQRGDTLFFRANAGPGIKVPFKGIISPSVIAVDLTGDRYTFARPPVTP